MEVGDRDRALAAAAAHPHDGVERGERDGTCPTDASRCSARWRRGSRACGCSPRAPRSRSRARACCTAWRRRGSTGSACAGGGCRRRRHVAQLRRRAGEERLGSTDSARAPAGRTRRRCCAPARRCAAAVGQLRRSSRERQPRDVDEARGPLDVELHQVDQVRAAGEKRAPACRARREAPSARRGARVANGFMRCLASPSPRTRLDRRDDVRGTRRSGRCCRSSRSRISSSAIGCAAVVRLARAAATALDRSARACSSRTGSASCSMNASCIGCSAVACARPSMVVISPPSCMTASVRHEFTRRPSTQHGARAALAVVAALLRAGEPELLAQRVEQRGPRPSADPARSKHTRPPARRQAAVCAGRPPRSPGRRAGPLRPCRPPRPRAAPTAPPSPRPARPGCRARRRPRSGPAGPAPAGTSGRSRPPRDRRRSAPRP